MPTAGADDKASSASGTMTEEFGDEDVVVSGISCRLPKSDNMEEFKDNLMNGIDMVPDDDERKFTSLFGLPRFGYLKDLSKFDAQFFGMTDLRANIMDTKIRLLLEVTYEAIVDAGVDPRAIRGSKTGVFVGAYSSEASYVRDRNIETTQAFAPIGREQTMFANRLSYFFDFKGPSFVMNTLCSSSLLALHQAVEAIKSGQCDAAVVAGSNIILDPVFTKQIFEGGMLSPGGKCSSFDSNGDGYCRSEGVVTIYIQKRVKARRIYCTVIGTGTNCDGHKPNGITFPSGACQKRLIEQVYRDVEINPTQIAYAECHGTGTKAGDPQEVNTICDVLCRNRETPLLIGSVKSNIGHTETCAGLAGLAKAIIAMNEGIIPRNIHYKNPNPNIPGLINGQLQVVTEDTKWYGGLVAINSFGYGGSNVHAIVKSHPCKTPPEILQGSSRKRLFVYSGRTEDGLRYTLTKVRENSNDINMHALLHETAFMPPTSHPFRGYTILGGTDVISIQKVPTTVRPVWFVFTGMGTQWHGMGRQMMQIDIFRESIKKCDAVLKPLNIHLYDMLMTGDTNVYEKTTNAFVAIASIQIAFADLLSRIGIKPDGIVGHSVGEVGCAYADGALTLEETVLAAYWRGHCIENANLPSGAMAVVGLTWQQARRQCPSGVEPACHNAQHTVTVSGRPDAVKGFVKELNERKIFAKEVNSSGVAFHSSNMKEVENSFRTALMKVIKSPKERTSRWISTSVPEKEWSTDKARYSSAEYFSNNLVNPVWFQEALSHIPNNVLVIEIAPHILLQAVLKRSLSQDCSIIGLMKKEHDDNVQYFLSNVGRCYQNGLTINISAFQEKVEFPVPVNTKMISPVLTWDHSRNFDVPQSEEFIMAKAVSADTYSFTIDLSPGSEYHFLRDHKVEDRVLFPASGYLLIAWKALAKKRGKHYNHLRVKLENLDIHRPTILPDGEKVTLEVAILPGTWQFVITEHNYKVVTGEISELEPEIETVTYVEKETVDYTMFKEDLQTIRLLKGLNFGQAFQGLIASDETLTKGLFTWCDNWILFLDLMIQMPIVKTDGLVLPKRIQSVTIDPQEHNKAIEEKENGAKVVAVQFNEDSNICKAGAVTIQGLFATKAPEGQRDKKPVLERYMLVPYGVCELEEKSEALTTYRDLCSTDAVKCLTEVVEGHSYFDGINKKHIQDTLRKAADVQIHDTKPTTFTSSDPMGYLSVINALYEGSDKRDPATVEQTVKEWKQQMLMESLVKNEKLQVMLDIFLENTPTDTVVISDTSASDIYPNITKLLNRHPAIHTLYEITKTTTGTDDEREKTDVLKLQNEPKSARKAHLILADNTLRWEKNISASLAILSEALEAGGFVLVREVTHNFHFDLAIEEGLHRQAEMLDDHERRCGVYWSLEKWRSTFKDRGFEIILETSDLFMSTTFLLKRSCENTIEKQIILDTDGVSFGWIEDLKSRLLEARTKPLGENVWLVAKSDVNGVVGLVKCIRRETGGERIRCVVGLEGSPNSKSTETVSKLLKQDLVMNVLSNGEVGSFRHLPLTHYESSTREVDIYLRLRTRGDLSSLQWVQLIETPSQQSENPERCTVHYSALNFRDIMMATGKLPSDAIFGRSGRHEDLLGCEFSGIDSSGRRVAGIVTRGIATSVVTKKSLLFPVPDGWTLEEASTIPMAYTMAYMALVVRGNLRRGDKVLIHSGSSCTGQAAIAIALYYDCDVFTTVSTQEKRTYLTSRFLKIKGSQIFNSKDTAFEEGIMKITNGRGVDMVLNSLAGEKLHASIRVLSRRGRFLEIGKYDAFNNTTLGMYCLMKNISIHGIHMDRAIDEENIAELMTPFFEDGVRDGVIKPFDTKVFEMDEAEEAFRYMATGKHIGKVLIKVPTNMSMSKTPSYIPLTQFNPGKSYIITGGLGGFGLQLARWMSERGARNIVLTTRSGVKTGYQAYMLKYLEKQYGTKVRVSKRNVADRNDVEKLIMETDYQVGGVFHLAAVLEDGLLQNLTKESFATVYAPKVQGILNLDKVTRKLCRDSCDYFVGFSSVASGMGNTGQSNYGLANSSMERVCELRKRDGLPGLAVQWGPIGDVGMVRKIWDDNDKVLAGLIPQRIGSCLETFEQFLTQQDPIVMSYVPAKKTIISEGKSEESIVDMVFRILEITDYEALDDNASLTDLGMDSLMAAELNQVLDREFGLSPEKVKGLTVKQFKELSNKPGPSNGNETKFAYDMIDRFIPKDVIVCLNKGENQEHPMYIIHHGYGNVVNMEEMSKYCNRPVFGIENTRQVPITSIKDMANFYLKEIFNHNHGKPFHLAGYSFGAVVALEMALQLQGNTERPECLKSLTLLDGSPEYLIRFNGNNFTTFHVPDDKKSLFMLLPLLRMLLSNDVETILDEMIQCKSVGEQHDLVLNKIVSQYPHLHRPDLEYILESLFRRQIMVLEYQRMEKYKGNIALISATDSDEIRNHIGKDYGLSKLCDGQVTVQEVPGDHYSFIEGESAKLVAQLLNNIKD